MAIQNMLIAFKEEINSCLEKIEVGGVSSWAGQGMGLERKNQRAESWAHVEWPKYEEQPKPMVKKTYFRRKPLKSKPHWRVKATKVPAMSGNVSLVSGQELSLIRLTGMISYFAQPTEADKADMASEHLSCYATPAGGQMPPIRQTGPIGCRAQLDEANKADLASGQSLKAGNRELPLAVVEDRSSGHFLSKLAGHPVTPAGSDKADQSIGQSRETNE
jgi:hypothetical protein